MNVCARPARTNSLLDDHFDVGERLTTSQRRRRPPAAHNGLIRDREKKFSVCRRTDGQSNRRRISGVSLKGHELCRSCCTTDLKCVGLFSFGGLMSRACARQTRSVHARSNRSRDGALSAHTSLALRVSSLPSWYYRDRGRSMTVGESARVAQLLYSFFCGRAK